MSGTAGNAITLRIVSFSRDRRNIVHKGFVCDQDVFDALIAGSIGILKPSHMEILQDLGLVPKPEEPPKKKPGRPKGSKNKAVIKEQEVLPTEGKRRRGRPKGSKNKPKPDVTATGQS